MENKFVIVYQVQGDEDVFTKVSKSGETLKNFLLDFISLEEGNEEDEGYFEDDMNMTIEEANVDDVIEFIERTDSYFIASIFDFEGNTYYGDVNFQ